MPYDLGDVVPLSISIKNKDGDPENATAVTLTITNPDGTSENPVVANPSAGVYECDFQTVNPGRHLVRWLATGNNAGAHVDVFDVRPASPPLLVSFADARAALNVNRPDDDEEIRALLEAITETIETFVGPVVRRSFTERHTRGPYLVLRRSPVIELTSVVGIGAGVPTFDVNEMDLDPGTGIVTFLDGRSFDYPTRVTFVAGREIIPAPIREAANIMLIHMWNVQRGAGGLPSLGGQRRDIVDYTIRQAWEPVVPGYGYAIPNRALELLGPYLLAPEVG
jgi:hypothetical protein